MSLELEKFSLNIFYVTLTSLKIDLIEWSEYRNSYNTSLGLPLHLQTSVKVFSDCIRTCIPESNLFDQSIASRIVRQWKRMIKHRKHIRTMY